MTGKRKRTTGSGEDSDVEELSTSGTGEVTKRTKHVTSTSEEDLTSSDITVAHPITHVISPPTTVSPSNPDPLNLFSVGTASPKPVTRGGPTRPRLIAARGKGPKAVGDAVFNKTRAYNYAPLDDAAVAVRNDPSSKTKSEALGEQGGVAYLQANTGYDDIELHRATTSDPHQLAAVDGQRWSHAVAFNGAGVADITYWDGSQVHVVEAKGGGSELGQRKQARFHETTNGQQVMDIAKPAWETNQGAERNLNNALKTNRGQDWKTFQPGDNIPNAVKNYSATTLYQGTVPYLTDIAHTMAKSKKADGRALVGQSILDNIDTVHYQPVSTQATTTEVNVHTMDVEKGKG